MKRLKRSIFTAWLGATFLALPATGAPAQWIDQGVALCTATEGQQFPTIASDGVGGAIVTWYDDRSGTGEDIYAQRVGALGNLQWATDGVALCTAAGIQQYPRIVSDGAGGAIVTWQDYRSSKWDIYAQRMDASGAVQWTTDGLALCTATGDQIQPRIVSDGAGGAIVTWEDLRSGDYNVYSQRVNAAGAVQWTTDGLALCTAAGDQMRPRIVSDGAGGAIVTWQDERSGSDWDVYVQRVDALGVVQWTADGVALCTATGDQEYPMIALDGAGGAIVTYQDYRSATDNDVYSQRVNATGAVQWTTDGVALCTAAGDQQYPTIVSDGAGGAIVIWEDLRGGNWDIYSQQVNAAGAVQWTGDGVSLCAAAGIQHAPRIVSDGAGGAIVTWKDRRSGRHDVYAQRVGALGNVQWATDGLALCLDVGLGYPAIASDGAGGAIVTWQDYRSGNWDIYAQRGTRQGYWGYPSPEITSIQDVPGDQGGQLRISFTQSRLDAWPDLSITHYSVWRALSPPAALAMKGHGIGLPNLGRAAAALVGRAYYSSSSGDWELIGTMEAHLWPEYGFTAATLRDSTSVDQGWEYYCVSAHGSGTFDFWNSAPDSGYSVDNLSPSPPTALAAEYIGGCQLYIHWNPNTEADLSHYAIYRGGAPDFVPDETNRIGTATDSSFVDEDFGYDESHYKVSAWDVHENESPFSLLTPDMITGTPGGNRHYGNVLHQNVPNPFVSATRIAFSIKEEGRVRLGVFDAKGRLVRALVDAVRGPGRYVEQWDARDGNGRHLPSATYFYLLEVSGWSASKKMTLAR